MPQTFLLLLVKGFNLQQEKVREGLSASEQGVTSGGFSTYLAVPPR